MESCDRLICTRRKPKSKKTILFDLHGDYMNKFTLLLALITLLVGAIPTQAHHSFSATFQADAKITREGVVTNFSFRNPHILVYFDVTNQDGSVTEWVSEGGAATLMRRAGWSADTIETGDHIRVFGDSTHDGSPMTSIDTIDILDPNTRLVINELIPSTGRQDPETVAAEAMPLTLPDGRPNLSGAWSNHGMANGRPRRPELDFSSAGEEVQATYVLANDGQVFCDPPGLVRQVGTTPHPISITQYEDRVVFQYEEYGGYREVFFDSRAHIGFKTHLGDSIARYEGNTLVIETINLLSNQISPPGDILSDQITTLEVYSRADNDTYGPIVNLDMYIEDPLYLNSTLVMSREKMSAGADYQMIENDCHAPLRERESVHSAMSFFLTSEGLGDGANLGGLDGADSHCQALAASVGQGDKNWNAYLSTTGENSVNARDRIGSGPWYNASGELVATDVEQLHSENWIARATALNERGGELSAIDSTAQDDGINSRHDILTGSELDGTASLIVGDTTCNNWTSNSDGGAIIGHVDRRGGGINPTSWNYAHHTRGCSAHLLATSDGDGLFYCFATGE